MVFNRSGPSLRTRFGISWRILKQSFGLLSRERDLWILPILSGLAMLVAMGLIFLGTDLFSTAAVGAGLLGQVRYYLTIALLMLPATFVTIFLNAALADAVYHRLDGEDRSVREALGSAWERLVTIFAYSVVSALVGALLSMVGQVASKLQVVPGLGRIIQAVGAFGWAVATYFVVPIIVVDRDTNVIDAISSSKDIARDRWGESIGGVVTVGLVLMVVSIPLVLLAVFGTMWLGISGAIPFETGLALMIAVMVVAFSIQFVLGAALNTTYQTALFRYARTGEAAGPFTEATLDDAWEPYRD